MFERKWKVHQSFQDENKKCNHEIIKVMHWNVLADSVSYRPRYHLEDILWQHRFPRIIDSICRLDADIVGLSEVDRLPLYDDVKTAMNLLGYCDYFDERHNPVKGFKEAEGSAIFYKKSKFVCLKQEMMSLCKEGYGP